MPRIWSRPPALETDLVQSWRRSLAETVGPVPSRVLAWAAAEGEVCVGSEAYLSVGGADGWRHLGWHEIERGGWNAETGRLQWRDYDGSRGSVRLARPGRLPELFRERVAASILVEQAMPFRGRDLLVAARRDLGSPSAPPAWHVTLGRGLTWSTPGVKEAAEDALARVRDDHGLI